MKKTLFLLLLGSLLSAQNPELFSNDWYISKMVINTQTTVSPIMDVTIGASKFINSGAGYNFQSRYYNSSGSTITFSTTSDSFTRQGGGCTLVVYNGINAAAAQAYDQKNCDFYMNSGSGTLFNYQILTTGTSKTLIITNSNTGNQIFYSNTGSLGIHENKMLNTFSVYPNPAKDYLSVNGIAKGSAVKIYDTAGRLVLEARAESTQLKLDVSHFNKGLYMMQAENYPAQKFFKE